MKVSRLAVGMSAFAALGIAALFLLTLPAAAGAMVGPSTPTPIRLAPVPLISSVPCTYQLVLVAMPSHVLVGQPVTLSSHLVVLGVPNAKCVQGLNFHYLGLPPGMLTQNAPTLMGFSVVPGVFNVALLVNTAFGQERATTTLTVT